MRLTAAPAAVALVLGLVGCSDDPDRPVDGPPSTPAAAPVAATDGEPVETERAVFEVPADWVVVQPEEALTSDDVLAPLGITGERVQELVDDDDVIALSDDGLVDGRIDNVVVLHFPGTLATTSGADAALAERYAALSVAVPEVSRVATPAGEAALISFTNLRGAVPRHSRVVQVDDGTDTVSVSIDARTREDADRIAEQVLATITLVD